MSYSKSGNNFLLDIMIAGDQKLTDFLQSRPSDEELGESLEIYEQHLDKIGQLTQKIKDDLRCCHIHYQSELLTHCYGWRTAPRQDSVLRCRRIP